ncbi:MAG TPA: SagB family peptide dehydrogenase [Vicinamibacterales bacterium]|nr:SagB family peptide dehydrogenase [Vicinamibacterales bacterium]
MLIRFRRAPDLVSYWKGGAFVLHNYATGGAVAVSPRTTELLDYFSDWKSADEFCIQSGVPIAKVRRLLATLVKVSLLQSSNQLPSPKESALTRWAAWNPAAGFFHQATRDVRFLDPIDVNRRLRQKARSNPPPAPVKLYPKAKTRALPRVHATGDFPRVLLSRRTWRQFARRPLALDSLAALLGLTGGVQQWARLPRQGDFVMKTSPSGGGRHPIELYVWARHVDGVAKGLYHYACDRHRLELVKAQRGRVSVRRYLPQQFWYEGAAAMVFFSAVYERYLWKYTYPRAYRATLVEAGHQCQTFCLVATWLGLAPFCSMALADSRIEGDLGLDGVSESVIYAAGVGVRPAGETVRSKPAGFPPLRVRPNQYVIAP